MALLGIISPCLVLFSCTSVFHQPHDIAAAIKPGYESQKRIVKQGWCRVPTGKGEVRAVYFGYDRNRDYRSDPITGERQGVDLIEYKKTRSDGSWEFTPFMVIADDDFDGAADRMWIDDDQDGEFEETYELKGHGIKMDEIVFFEVSPWPEEIENRRFPIRRLPISFPPMRQRDPGRRIFGA